MPLLPSAAAGFALGASLIVAIGAQNAFVLRQGLRREHVGAVVALCAAADLALSAAGVAGLGAALSAAPWLRAASTLAGAAFLLWYAACALGRALHPGTLDAGGGEALSLRQALVRAAGFTLLNPHVYLDTVLLLGAVGAARAAGERAAFVVGTGLASACWFAALGYGARLLTPLFARLVAWRILDGVVAALMAALAVGLLRGSSAPAALFEHLHAIR